MPPTSSVKIKNAGPPNQFFQNNESSLGSAGHMVENEDEGEEEDCEPVEDGALIKNEDDGEIGITDPPPNDDILAGPILITDQSIDSPSTDRK